MEAWREKGIELFPEYRNLLTDPEEHPWWFLGDLLRYAVEAEHNDDVRRLEKIFSFTEWCFQQRNTNPELWEGAFLSFYEHLVDKEVTCATIPYWVKPEIFSEMRFEYKKRLSRKGKLLYHDLIIRYNDFHGTDFHTDET
jgi:hypothetical protein